MFPALQVPPIGLGKAPSVTSFSRRAPWPDKVRRRVTTDGAGPKAQVPAAHPQASTADAAVIAALRGGDEEAFTRLVDRHHAALRRIARLYVSNPAIAEEVVQETWLAVIQGVWAFQGRSSLRTWILRILINRAKTRAQREGRTVPFADAGVAEPVAGDSPDPDLGGRPDREDGRGSWLLDPGLPPRRRF